MAQTTTMTRPAAAAAGVRRRMWPETAAGRRFSIGMAVALALGFAIRAWFVLGMQVDAGLPGDSFWYHFQAKAVADGLGFLDPFVYQFDGRIVPGADHPPGFVAILAALDCIGIDSPQGQRLVMCVVGTATIWLVGLLGRRLATPAVGVVAALLAAIYPNVWINDGMLMPETPFVFATAASLLCAYRYLERPRQGEILLVSGGVTLAAMARPEALLLFGVLVLPLVLRRRSLSWRDRVIHLVLAALVPIVAFAPWVAYNLGRFEEPVTISTGGGQTLAAANCDLTYDGLRLGYYDLGCFDPKARPVPSGDPSERDIAYRESALDYMADHAGELPKVVAARVGRLWHLYRVDEGITLDSWVERRAGGAQSADRRLVTAALVGYYVLLPLAVIGGVVLRRRRVPIWPLLTQPAVVTLAAALTFGITRYRAGAELTFVVLAAVAICWGWDRVRASRTRRREPSAPPPGPTPSEMS
jgi:4-amino-4-deoxy-L-arabinose transferase-like glycosyltransferase